jgi:hypothetical protein
MKQIILASAFAVAAVFSSVVPSQAASVVITTDHGRPMHRDMRPHHRCFTKTEKVRSHGRTIIKQTKVCR